ncbi:YheC/YheD family protein [Bacillus sp. H-16]|uniref:YheC/YheD family protein n=1 Tax=Alteribacter salitolerans TaxID=2912333 RepID=UPI00196240E3|nr:YheC/YheD family protein [Alteribacter salitolerans]MBM7094939.1 YheC/YheD family protein [Alteribacter salitolerans]
MIGVLVSKKTFKAVVKGTTKIESPGNYQRFAKEHKMPVAFYYISEDLFRGAPVNVVVFSPNSKPRKKKIKPPKHTFCRMVVGGQTKRRLKRLMRRTGMKFYQLQTGRERNKWRHIAILTGNSKTASYVPESRRMTSASFQDLIQKYGEVIIKPIRGSLGRKVIMIRKDGPHFKISSKTKKKLKVKIVKATVLKKIITSLSGRKYIVQQKVRATKAADRTVEVRVSTHKKNASDWVVSAKALRLSKKKDFLTNISQGAKGVPFNEKYFKKPNIKSTVESASKELAKQLAKKIPAIDFGFDLMVDDEGNVWFIEANLRDMKLTYMSAGEYEYWYQSVAQPLRFIAGEMAKDT